MWARGRTVRWSRTAHYWQVRRQPIRRRASIDHLQPFTILASEMGRLVSIYGSLPPVIEYRPTLPFLPLTTIVYRPLCGTFTTTIASQGRNFGSVGAPSSSSASTFPFGSSTVTLSLRCRSQRRRSLRAPSKTRSGPEASRSDESACHTRCAWQNDDRAGAKNYYRCAIAQFSRC
jgi:hypothetical protein